MVIGIVSRLAMLRRVDCCRVLLNPADKYLFYLNWMIKPCQALPIPMFISLEEVLPYMCLCIYIYIYTRKRRNKKRKRERNESYEVV